MYLVRLESICFHNTTGSEAHTDKWGLELSWLVLTYPHNSYLWRGVISAPTIGIITGVIYPQHRALKRSIPVQGGSDSA